MLVKALLVEGLAIFVVTVVEAGGVKRIPVSAPASYASNFGATSIPTSLACDRDVAKTVANKDVVPLESRILLMR